MSSLDRSSQSDASPHADTHARRGRALLILILVLAGALRFASPGQSPPGIQVDAAANAWNAYCLLKTGRDWHGKPWPLFYTPGFGEDKSTLSQYALIPFEAVGGMSAVTSCLPSAVAGVLSVLLLYGVGRRLFGRGVGLIAAALAAVSPWHLFLSRWGHESGLVPLLTVAPVAALLWARLPLCDRIRGGPRFFPSFLAGALTGICCYGYGAVRVFLPVLLLGLVVVNAPRWWALAGSARGRAAAAGLLLGLAVTLGPLAHAHLTDPEMNKRATSLAVWDPSDAAGTRIVKALDRYAGHFAADFLFVRGDVYPLHTLPGLGPLPWYMAPLLVAGLAAAVLDARKSAAARAIILWIAVYPVGDVFWKHPSLHLLRSAPGICCLLLLAALGAARAVGWIARKSRRAGWVAGLVLVLAVVVATGRFVFDFFGEFNRRWDTYQMFNADLLEASRWLRPRLDDFDAVVISGENSAAMELPFIVVLVGLEYDPNRWFRDVIEVEHRPDLDLYHRFGKIRFLFDDTDRAAVRSLRSNGRPDRVLLIVRPGEWVGGTPVHEIRLPDGRPTFLIYDEVM